MNVQIINETFSDWFILEILYNKLSKERLEFRFLDSFLHKYKSNYGFHTIEFKVTHLNGITQITVQEITE